MTLSYYIDKLQSIRPDRSSGRARPHKVCMMFAVIDLIEQGHINNNRIYYDNTLKNRFSWHFERLKQGNDADSPFLPFRRGHIFWCNDISKRRVYYKNNRVRFSRRCIVSVSQEPSDVFNIAKRPLFESRLTRRPIRKMGKGNWQVRQDN